MNCFEFIKNINWNYYFVSVCGAAILYFKMKNEGKSPWKFVAFINADWDNSTIANFIDILLFMFIGGGITMVTQPNNILQCFSGGMAWTTFLSGSNYTKNSIERGENNE